MQHINDLTEPPVVGKFYMVPTVSAVWSGSVGEFPVIGPLHNDRQHIGFDRDHWHIDTRFLPERGKLKHESTQEYWLRIMATPVMRSWKSSINQHTAARSVAAVYLRRWQCKRHAIEHISIFESRAVSSHAGWKAHFDHYAGHKCKHDGAGWRCPHRNVSLATQPVINGVVRCPLHALMIDNATGRVLSRQRMHQEIQLLCQTRVIAQSDHLQPAHASKAAD